MFSLDVSGLRTYSEASSTSEIQKGLTRAKQKHLAHLVKQLDDAELTNQLKDIEFTEYCDKALRFAQGDDTRFYKHLESRTLFLQTSKVVNILLARVFGDVEKLPWEMKMALEERGRETEPAITLELSDIFISKNMLFRLARLMKNITSISLTNCIFEKGANCLFDHTLTGDQPKPSKMIFPKLKTMVITGHVLSCEALEASVQGLQIARRLIELSSANISPRDIKNAILPAASDDQMLEFTKQALSYEMEGLLSRRAVKRSGNKDQDLLIEEDITTKQARELQLFGSWR